MINKNKIILNLFDNLKILIKLQIKVLKIVNFFLITNI